MAGSLIISKDSIDLGFSPLANFALEPLAALPMAGHPGRTILDLAAGLLAVDDGIDMRYLAPLDSPAFTDLPTAPTPIEGDNSTLIATTAFVTTAVAAEAALREAADDAEEAARISADAAEEAARIAADAAEAASRSAADATLQANINAEEVARGSADNLLQTQIDAFDTEKADLNSPAFTGNPTAPTQSIGDNSTRIATTAFVRDILPSGVVVMWTGATWNIPSGWVLCNGANGTPDLRNRFIVGAGSTYDPGDTGGQDSITDVPAHTHADTFSVDSEGAHTHYAGTYAAASAGAHTHDFSGNRTDVDNNLAASTANIVTNLTNGTNGTDANVTSSDGAHTHDVTGQSGGVVGTHTHGLSGSISSAGVASVDIRPRYYALCYIMKT